MRPRTLAPKLLLVVPLAAAVLACGGPVAPPPPKTEPAKPAPKAAAAAPTQEGNPDIVPNAKWDMIKEFFFAYADSPLPSIKNAFWSNMDKYMPRIEDAVAEPKPDQDESKAEVLAIEKFPPEDYKIIMIIGGTAVPKAILIDPLGARHVVRKDNRLGNRNGVIDEITEFEVVVKEPYADKPIILSIKPPYVDWSKKFDYTGE